MTAYCLFQNLDITDREKMQTYATTVEPITHAFGGQYVTKAGAVDVKEGDWAPTYPVIIKFPSMEAARTWYDSDAYAPLKALRTSAGRFSAVFIEGNTE
ncbi:DUF1330 domain-containing protein [Gymnodinialimonas sp.]